MYNVFRRIKIVVLIVALFSLSGNAIESFQNLDRASPLQFLTMNLDRVGPTYGAIAKEIARRLNISLEDVLSIQAVSLRNDPQAYDRKIDTHRGLSFQVTKELNSRVIYINQIINALERYLGALYMYTQNPGISLEEVKQQSEHLSNELLEMNKEFAPDF